MLNALLTASTLLGGLSAVWFFAERVASSARQRAVRSGMVDDLRVKPSAGLAPWAVIGLQWVIAVYVLGATSHGLAGFGAFGALWVVPFSYCLARFVVRAPMAARIVGGLLGALLGGAFAYMRINEDWSIRYGLVFGMFFCAVVTGYFAEGRKEATFGASIITTVMLLAALGVFGSWRFYLQLDGFALGIAAGAAIEWLLIVMLVAIVRQYILKVIKVTAKD